MGLYMDLTRKKADGTTSKTFKYIGSVPTLTENLKDKWEKIPLQPAMTIEEEKVLTMLEERLSTAKQAHLRAIDVMNASYLQYRSVNYYTQMYGAYPTYWNQWGASAFIPRTFETVEAMRAQLKSKQPDWAAKPLEKKWSEYAENVTRLSHSEWNRSKSQDEAVEALDDAILWGVGILENTLINDVRTEQAIKFDTDGNLTFTPEKTTKYYGTASIRRDPYDVFPEPSPDATKIVSGPSGRGKISYCFYREIVDVEDLRSEYQNLKETSAYGVTDKYQYLKPGGDLIDYKYLRTHVDELYQVRQDVRYPATVSEIYNGSKIAPSTGRAASDGKIEKWTYLEGDRKIVFAMGMVLRDMPNPFPHKEIPLTKFNIFDTKTFRGVGYPEIMRWLQIIENTLYDQGLNNVVMNVHKMFAINTRYIEDEGDLVVRPFGIVHLKPIPGAKASDAIQPIEFAPLFNDYFNFLSLNKSNIQTVTGTSEFATGGVTKESKVERATVANRIVQGGLLRAGEVMRRFEQNLIGPAVEQQIAIQQLYYQIDIGGNDGLDVEAKVGDEMKYFRYIPQAKEDLSDDQAKTAMDAMSDQYDGVITNDAIQGRYRIDVVSGSSQILDPEDESALMLDFTEKFGNIVDPDKIVGRDAKGQPIGAPVFDMKKLGMEVARKVFKVASPEDYLYKTPDERKANASPTDLPLDEAGADAVPADGGGGAGGGALPAKAAVQ